MQRRILLILILFFCATAGFSRHLKGGWIFYEYLGDGDEPNTSKYRITVNQYMSCSSEGSQIDASVFVGIYDAATNQQKDILIIDSTSSYENSNAAVDPCISDAPKDLCYLVVRYVEIVSLPNNNAGYILGIQRCCRIENIVNLVNSESAGITYSVAIPGIVEGSSVRDNNSPVFSPNDLSIICINSPFTLDFSATDADNDSLVYTFCSGLTGGSVDDPRPASPSNPPFSRLTYLSPYSGASPLGSLAQIDSRTGIISGIAPSKTGDYVVAVCVTEYRDGIAISSTRKEIHVTVGNCAVSGAFLKPSYITCDGYTFTFENLSTASNINSYEWSLGFDDSVSTLPTPTVTYPDTGRYNIKLTVKNGNGCKSSALTILNVYPGFKADFSVSGSCLQSAFSFTDKSTTVYGEVDSWRWDFGDLTTLADTSRLQKPDNYKYSNTGTVTAQLIATNSKGCMDTLTKDVIIYDKPLITMPFHDTLICKEDQLLLSAYTDINASYTWTPPVNIRNENTSTPLVSPQSTLTYYVTISDNNGCTNTDSVLVNVIDHVTVSLGNDTTICLTDTIQLIPVSNGLYFAWSPAETLSSDTAKAPLATPETTTTYHLNASVGACAADDEITIRTAPYPVANAGTANPICYGATTLLNASYEGTSFTWSPASTLLNSNSLTPTAGPSQTTTYLLTVRDNSADGCPKPASDTVTVVVIPPVQVDAGRDTNIVVGQPLQLVATGALNYQWSPATGMDNNNIANPLVTLSSNITRITYLVKGITEDGCSDMDSVTVFQYKTVPEIFVPSAFTPDNDGTNDIIRPIVAGIKRFENFSIYDRWGKLMYTTRAIGQGWDGTFRGTRQPPGTYVYVASATDYLDRHMVRKGTVVLIR